MKYKYNRSKILKTLEVDYSWRGNLNFTKNILSSNLIQILGIGEDDVRKFTKFHGKRAILQ